MDQESIVYGCIKDASHLVGDRERRVNNRNIMLSLPKADEWPFLCQEMFSIPSEIPGMGMYQTDVMHFGASYQAVEYEWDQWIQKFEEMLSRMYWVSATVHLETELSGTHTFTWNSAADSHVPGSGDMNIHCEWSHEPGLAL